MRSICLDGDVAIDIYKNSNGDFVCKSCGKAHTQFSSAMDCAKSHRDPGAGKEEMQSVVIGVTVAKRIEAYHQDMVDGGTIEAQKRLVLSMIEDYHISKESDILEKRKIGPMTMNLARNASEGLSALNKMLYGERSSSVNVNIDARKKTDVAALRELIERARPGGDPLEIQVVQEDASDVP